FDNNNFDNNNFDNNNFDNNNFDNNNGDGKSIILKINVNKNEIINLKENEENNKKAAELVINENKKTKKQKKNDKKKGGKIFVNSMKKLNTKKRVKKNRDVLGKKTILKRGLAKTPIKKRVHFNLSKNTVEYIPSLKNKNKNTPRIVLNKFQRMLNLSSLIWTKNMN
ncbi:nucleolar protein Nop52, putative, partial [Hepatocystis sp. ex Piliocolobus tephrosceles]